VTVYVERDGERAERILNVRDLISVPPGVHRGILNNTDEEALMCVMLGASKPQTPTYPPDHPLAKLRRK
jgi:quercetin dioxygenase-like cupin family protein